MSADADRQICTVETPCDGKGPWAHPSAVEVGTCYESCCDKYHCPICGTRFTVECAQ